MIPKTVTPTELTEKLHTLLSCDALELISDTPNPVHCSTNTRFGLIIRHQSHETLTIWFSNCMQSCKFYQYHRIGHFWTKGMEHWRRLVYIIGTIHEKYTFLGKSSCNALEQELLPLIEFAPFRYWSPLHESLDDYYINSQEGILCMKQLATDTKDFSYARMIQLYEHLPCTIQTFPWVISFLAKKLTSPKHKQIYEYLDSKINAASTEYQIRDYGSEINEEIKKIRIQFTKELYADGYVGEYPYFKKENATLIAVEEHPFTILESNTFKFKIYGMILTPEYSIQLYRNETYIL